MEGAVAQKQAQAAQQFADALVQQVIDGMTVTIPDAMVENQLDGLIAQLRGQLEGQGATLEQYLEYSGTTMEQLRDEYEPQAKKEVTLRLALEKIADTEDIQVSDEELDEALTEFAGQLQAPVEFVKSRIPVEDYRTDLRVQKVVELIKNNAVVDNDIAEEAAEEAPAEETKAEEAAADAE